MVYRKKVFNFTRGSATPPLDIDLLGCKGLGLAEMAALELPVPPGFIITTEACSNFREKGELCNSIKEEIFSGIEILENETELQFDSIKDPLFVSVRSGGAVSMPGMMETILNLGFNDKTVIGFAKTTGNEHLAYSLYCRFLMKYGELVSHIDRRLFEKLLNSVKKQEGAELDIDLSTDGLKEACSLFKELYEVETGSNFPQDIQNQLLESICAIFSSWDSPRATLYRQIHNISHSWGTAVTVQEMAFGNKNQKSATGIAFTRSPISGESQLSGEFLLNAQGEELENGNRIPHPISKQQQKSSGSPLVSLEELMPDIYNELANICAKLETYLRDMQDIEFTVENGKLYLLQTRSGKRTGIATVRIAAEMLLEGLIDEKTALKKLEEHTIFPILMPLSPRLEEKYIAKGVAAVPGAAAGKTAFSLAKALDFKKRGIPYIFVQQSPSPDDFPAIVASCGILSLRGGITSHAAFAARGLGKPCIVGCSAIHLNQTNNTLTCNNLTIKEGDPITIDGTTGHVYLNALPLGPSPYFEQLIELAKEKRFDDIRTVLVKNECLT